MKGIFKPPPNIKLLESRLVVQPSVAASAGDSSTLDMFKSGHPQQQQARKGEQGIDFGLSEIYSPDEATTKASRVIAVRQLLAAISDPGFL